MNRQAWLLFMLMGLGCSSQDGDLMARIMQRTGEKLETTAGGSTNQFAGRLRSTAQPSIGLAERVDTRLRWDRYVDGVEVQVEFVEEGVVRLKGAVPDLARKQRILDITRTTMGVKDVRDELVLPKEEK
ncbi:MAG: BON domain-containing protein [Gemmataceae bacterium]